MQANLLYTNTVRSDNNERRDEEMFYGMGKLQVCTLQFKVTAKLKKYTWHKMPLLPTQNVVGLKIAVITFWEKLILLFMNFLYSRFCTGSKIYFLKKII